MTTESLHAWQSHSGQKLAELHNLLRDLRACRGILHQIRNAEFEAISQQLLLASYAHYRRAFAGNRCLTAADLDSMEANDRALHWQILAAANAALDHPQDPSQETEVVIAIRADQAERVEVAAVGRARENDEIPERWSALTSTIEANIVLPMLRQVEAMILGEAHCLGIQLIRHLPIVATDVTQRIGTT